MELWTISALKILTAHKIQKAKYLIYNKQANYTSVCLKQP